MKIPVYNVAPIHWDYKYWMMSDEEKAKWREDNNIHIVEIDCPDLSEEDFKVEPPKIETLEQVIDYISRIKGPIIFMEDNK